MSVNKKLLLIINPRAGRMRAKTALFGIVDRLCAGGYEPTVYLTKGRGDATTHILECGMDYDVITCCGGDGTLNEMISGVIQLPGKRTVGYIPCGSTNDFASTLGIPLKINSAADAIVSGDLISLDIGIFNDNRYFAYVASFGMFTQLSYETSQQFKNSLGHLAYVIDGALQLSEIKPYHLRSDCDGIIDEGEYIFGAVTNSTSIAGIYNLPADVVTLNDGMFELFLLKYPKTPADLNDLLRNLARKNFNDNNIIMHHGKKIVFDSDIPIPYTLDGEYGGDPNHVEMNILHGAVNIIASTKKNKIK